MVEQFQKVFASLCWLTNLYGPTEVAIDVSFYDCVETLPGVIPIGQALTGCQLYVLDQDSLALKADSEEGEIAIGGICLAEGYYNREDLTDKAFIFHPELQQRIYLTGDLGWYEEGRGFFCSGSLHSFTRRWYADQCGVVPNRGQKSRMDLFRLA
ncbi:AMP-binding protein [Photorhabdus asymbiotica]